MWVSNALACCGVSVSGRDRLNLGPKQRKARQAKADRAKARRKSEIIGNDVEENGHRQNENSYQAPPPADVSTRAPYSPGVCCLHDFAGNGAAVDSGPYTRRLCRS